MKRTLLLTGVCGAVIVIAVAAQNRGFEPGGPQSRIAAALDANHDGTISTAEIRAASSALLGLDVNKDGRLLADELRPAFGPDGRNDGRAGFGGRRGRGEEAEGRGAAAASGDDLADTLMAFDRDGDGKLVRAEVPERFQGLFDRADGNKDGALSRDELTQSANASAQQDPGRGGRGGRGRGGMRDPLLRALDADADGALSESEIAGAPDALKTLDVNGDGQLAAEEFRPAPMRGFGGRGGGRR
jgi:Ca2+-binding EF-hand superfamily protein